MYARTARASYQAEGRGRLQSAPRRTSKAPDSRNTAREWRPTALQASSIADPLQNRQNKMQTQTPQSKIRLRRTEQPFPHRHPLPSCPSFPTPLGPKVRLWRESIPGVRPLMLSQIRLGRERSRSMSGGVAHALPTRLAPPQNYPIPLVFSSRRRSIKTATSSINVQSMFNQRSIKLGRHPIPLMDATICLC